MAIEHRIIDANANRAREALRVLEDAARFALDNPELSGAFKVIRHDFRAAMDRLCPDSTLLLAWRDTPGDVGTSLKAPDESHRPTLAAVATAAAKRLSEALRTIEEYAKVLSGAPEEFESLRYRAYEAETRLMLGLGAGPCQWRLCVLITESACTFHPWDRIAEMSLEGGADCLQLREKSLDGGALLERARRLVQIASAAGASVIVNDRPDVALLARAHGVHLGQADLPVREVRRLAGSSLVVGVSTTNLHQARCAAADGADYLGLGPMFPTSTTQKPNIAGPAYLTEYLTAFAVPKPHLAIGGIGPDNVDVLARHGCRGVAVCASVCGAKDPADACRRISSRLATK